MTRARSSVAPVRRSHRCLRGSQGPWPGAGLSVRADQDVVVALVSPDGTSASLAVTQRPNYRAQAVGQTSSPGGRIGGS